MLDVGEDKFLVLLFVVQSQHNGVLQASFRKGLPHGRVDMRAIGENLVQSGAGQKSAAWPRVPGTERFVIGIEQKGEARVESLVARQPGQDHRLEEPAGMRQM